LAEIGGTLNPTDTERTIAARAAHMLAARGYPDTWYYDCPALVLLGSRSCQSISGRQYVPADEPVGASNLVTVDLSPRDGDVWGDCARSFVVETGCHVSRPAGVAFRDGLEAEAQLHAWLRRTAAPDLPAGALFEAANAEIRWLGYENLDFARNVGHSIVRDRADRVFLERGAQRPLGSLGLFTFEPHICRAPGGVWGFKHENIYYFDEAGQIVEL
jgi:hypothetical protein